MAAAVWPAHTFNPGELVTAATMNGMRDQITEVRTQVGDGTTATASGNLTVSGLLQVNGYGAHGIGSAGSGVNALTIRNSGVSVTAAAALYLGNDISAIETQLFAFSSTFTAAGPQQPAGSALVAAGAGGLSLWANAGAIRFYSGGNAEKARIHASGGMSIGNTTDPGNTSLSVTGNLSVGSNISAYSISATFITLGSGNISAAYLFATSYVVVGGTTLSNTLPALRSDGSGTLAVIRADGSAYTAVSAGSYYSAAAGNNFADLTVRGATNFASLTTTGNVNAAGNIVNTGQIFPGRVDASGQQGSWYLASHASYGLYCNTGFYLVGSMNAGSYVARGGGNSFPDFTCTGATSFQGGINIYAGQLYVNSGGNAVNVNGHSYLGGYVQIGAMAPFTASRALLQSVSANLNILVGDQTTWTNCAALGFITMSDARLKIDRGRATDLSALRKVVIHDFTWKDTDVEDRGLFAQEAIEHFPTAIHRGTDEKTDKMEKAGHLVQPWMIEHGKIVPHLIAGWQYLDDEVTKLRAELNTLKGRA